MAAESHYDAFDQTLLDLQEGLVASTGLLARLTLLMPGKDLSVFTDRLERLTDALGDFLDTEYAFTEALRESRS